MTLFVTSGNVIFDTGNMKKAVDFSNDNTQISDFPIPYSPTDIFRSLLAVIFFIELWHSWIPEPNEAD